LRLANYKGVKLTKRFTENFVNKFFQVYSKTWEIFMVWWSFLSSLLFCMFLKAQKDGSLRLQHLLLNYSQWFLENHILKLNFSVKLVWSWQFFQIFSQQFFQIFRFRFSDFGEAEKMRQFIQICRFSEIQIFVLHLNSLWAAVNLQIFSYSLASE
jgi:hypothetical protein